MKREIVIVVELGNECEILLEDLRWRHIDIEEILNEELREDVAGIIRAYGEIGI